MDCCVLLQSTLTRPSMSPMPRPYGPLSSSTTNTTHKSSGRGEAPGEDTGKGNSHPLIHPAEDRSTQNAQNTHTHRHGHTHTHTRRVSLWGRTNRYTCNSAAKPRRKHVVPAAASRCHTHYTVHTSRHTGRDHAVM